MKPSKSVICSVVAVISLVTGGVAVTGSKAPVGQVAIGGESFGKLRISPEGLAIIGNAEGCRQSPYVCPAGHITNGIGNTKSVPNAVVSLQEVAKNWVSNLQRAEQCISLAEAKSGKVMTQGQFDAFTSFSFNTGCTRFRRNPNGTETKIYLDIKQGNFTQACIELTRWVYGGGVKLNGLVERRRKERERCLSITTTKVG